MNNLKKCVFILVAFVLASQLAAQPSSRGTGIGLRSAVWKPADPSAGIDVGIYPTTVISGSGQGGIIYFFTRVADRWFLEAGTGELGQANFVKAGSKGSHVGNSSVTPVQVGARYDWLPPKYGSSFQPYLSFGSGIYFISKNDVSSTVAGSRVSNDNESQLGLYAGTGLNLILKSWFAINVDVKAHLLNFDPGAGYSGLQYGIGFSFMWGRKAEMFRIEEVKVVVQDIYPAYYQFYNSYPLALVSVKNTVAYPIEVNVHSDVKGFSEREVESGFVRIGRGETKDIPVHAIFGEKLLYSAKREPAVIDINIEARAGSRHTKSMSVNVIVHSRNAWNGEADRLGYFITPDNPEIMQIGRKISAAIREKTGQDPQNFEVARSLFNELDQLGIHYQSDPNIPFYKDDYVQYATETLEGGVGDCDDLVVLYASLLESVGIKTAFVQVQDPAKELAHLYLVFDSGLTPDQQSRISSNEKRLIIREKSNGKKSVWVPVETTLLDESFESAWKTAALNYLQEGEMRNGLALGWMKIIDVH